MKRVHIVCINLSYTKHIFVVLVHSKLTSQIIEFPAFETDIQRSINLTMFDLIHNIKVNTLSVIAGLVFLG